MRTLIRFTTVVTASCALFAACRSGVVPNQVLTKPAPVHAPPPVARSAGRWVYNPSTAAQRFTIDQSAAITVGVDSAARTDTVTSHADVAFSNTPSTRG